MLYVDQGGAALAVAARGLETEIMPLLLLSFKSLSRFYLAKLFNKVDRSL